MRTNPYLSPSILCLPLDNASKRGILISRLMIKTLRDRWPVSRINGRGIPFGLLPRLFREFRPPGPMLHLCCGPLHIPDATNLDIIAGVKPDIVADATRLPFRDGSFAFVLADPPYSNRNTVKLYNTAPVKLYSLLSEMSRVTTPGGHYSLVYWFQPNTMVGDIVLADILFSGRPHMAPRVLTVYKRGQWPGLIPKQYRPHKINERR